MSWMMSISVLASGWLLCTPFLWQHNLATALVAFGVGLVGFLVSGLAVLEPRYRKAVALLGMALGVSVFAFPDTLATTVNHVVIGSLLWIAGISPEPYAVARVPVPATQPEPAHEEPLAA
jgi:hypothetical protein